MFTVVARFDRKLSMCGSRWLMTWTTRTTATIVPTTAWIADSPYQALFGRSRFGSIGGGGW
jgi:hypothetical protein